MALPKGNFEVLRATLGVSKKNIKEECLKMKNSFNGSL